MSDEPATVEQVRDDNEKNMAILGMILGLMSLVFAPFGPVGLYLSWRVYKQRQARGAEAGNEPIIGIITGLVGTVVLVAIALFLLLYFAAFCCIIFAYIAFFIVYFVFMFFVVLAAGAGAAL